MRGVSARRVMWLTALAGAATLSILGTIYTYTSASRSVVSNGGSGCWDMGPEECGRSFALMSLAFTVPLGAAIGAALGLVMHWAARRFLICLAGRGPTAHPPANGPEA